MDNKITEFKAAITAVIGLLTALWGWLGWLVIGWVAAMAMDIATGVFVALKNGDLSSKRAREGTWHKGGMIVVVLVSAGTDLLISLVLDNLPVLALPVAYSGLVCPVVLVWYIITEAISITENAVAMGAPVPKWLVKLLAAGKQAVDQAGKRITKEDSDDAK